MNKFIPILGVILAIPASILALKKLDVLSCTQPDSRYLSSKIWEFKRSNEVLGNMRLGSKKQPNAVLDYENVQESRWKVNEKGNLEFYSLTHRTTEFRKCKRNWIIFGAYELWGDTDGGVHTHTLKEIEERHEEDF